MKRWISLLLSLILVLNLTACNDQPSGTTENDTDHEMTGREETLGTETPSQEVTEETKAPELAPVTGTTEVIAAQYDEAWPFSEGFAVVGRDDGDGMKYNYIDTQGQLLLEEWVDVARSFSEGLACVGYDANQSIEMSGFALFWYGYIDVNGELVIPAEILSTERHCPCAFYQGYAEINDYTTESSYGMCTNVIDREGNRLFEFDVDFVSNNLGSSYKRTGYVQKHDRAFELWAQGPESGYYRNNEWMKAYVEGFDGDVVLLESNSEKRLSHVVDSEGNILRTMEGTVTALGDDYYVQSIVYNEPAKIYDSQWNLLDEAAYAKIEETEYGLYLATNLFGRYVLLNRYLTPVTDPYHEVSIVPDGYLVNLGHTFKWKLRGPDGTEIFLLSKAMNSCEYKSMNCYTADGYRQDVCGIYVGTDHNDSKTTHVFDEAGQLLFSSQGIFKPDIALLREDGIWLVEGKEKDQVIDRNGNLLLELPYAGCKVYGAGEDRIHLYAGTDYRYGSSLPRSYVLMELVNADDQWELVDKGIVALDKFDFRVPGYRIVLAENEESVIVSDGLNTGPVTLERTDGTVLEENCKSVSLVEDGLYLVIRAGQGACLKYFGEAVSEVYENLDVLSEEYIAFCEDGKWGYLRIERE